MEKELKKHIGFVENILKEENSVRDWDALSDYNRMQIGFFQHERLVHLLITFFFGLLYVIFIIATVLPANVNESLPVFYLGILFISIVLLIMLAFYVLHYFTLENGVQRLYRLEKEIMKRCRKVGDIE